MGFQIGSLIERAQIEIYLKINLNFVGGTRSQNNEVKLYEKYFKQRPE